MFHGLSSLSVFVRWHFPSHLHHLYDHVLLHYNDVHDHHHGHDTLRYGERIDCALKTVPNRIRYECEFNL